MGCGVLEYFDLFTRSDNNNNNKVIIMSSTTKILNYTARGVFLLLVPSLLFTEREGERETKFVKLKLSTSDNLTIIVCLPTENNFIGTSQLQLYYS